MDIQQHINEELKMEKEPTNNTKVMEEFEKRFVGRNGLVYSGELTAGKIKQFISQKLKQKEKETLDFIAEREGWEESRDIYAEKLNLPKIYD